MASGLRATPAVLRGPVDPGRARDQLAALLPDRERVLGADHPNTLTTRLRLARYTGDAGDAAGARDSLTALLADAERVLGPEHRSTVAIREGLDYWTRLSRTSGWQVAGSEFLQPDDLNQP